MAYYGSHMNEAGIQVHHASGSTSHGGDTNWQTIGTYSDLDAGVYLAWWTFSPGTNDGDYPNSDADAYEIKIQRNGTDLVNTHTHPEGSPDNCRNASGQNCIFTSDGTDDITFHARTSDGDAGGYTARYQLGVHVIMRKN